MFPFPHFFPYPLPVYMGDLNYFPFLGPSMHVLLRNPYFLCPLPHGACSLVHMSAQSSACCAWYLLLSVHETRTTEKLQLGLHCLTHLECGAEFELLLTWENLPPVLWDMRSDSSSPQIRNRIFWSGLQATGRQELQALRSPISRASFSCVETRMPFSLIDLCPIWG